MAVSRKPPTMTTGPVAWLRENLFSSIGNSVITVVTLVFLVWGLYAVLSWTFFEANWGRVWVNLKLFSVYRYPLDLLWRPMTLIAIVLGLLGLMAGASRRTDEEIVGGVFWWFSSLVFFITIISFSAGWSVSGWWLLISALSLAGYGLGMLYPRVTRWLPWLWGASLIAAIGLLYGIPGLEHGALRFVEDREWGGFLLTVVLSAVGIVVSFPLGIALALGRRSKLPAIKYFCILFIEIVRGAPLISWLFIASLLLPLLLDVGPDAVSALVRAMVAVTLFSAAYMAENIRGGLQAVPRGQSEAARALGLNGWQTTRLIVLPQAIKAVIPAIVGQAISLFKDTTLVFIVGLFDFFAVAEIVANQPESLLVPGGIRLELSLFLAVVYWYFAYRMSVASRQLEKRLGVGTR